MARMLAVDEEAIKKAGSTTNGPAHQRRTTMAIPNVSAYTGSIRLFSLGTNSRPVHVKKTRSNKPVKWFEQMFYENNPVH